MDCTLIRRLILTDGTPTAYDEKYIPYSKGEPVIERELHYAQFPDVFTDQYVPRTIWTNMDICACAAPDYVCIALDCKPGSVLLRVDRTICSREGTHIGFGRRWLIGKNGRLTATSDYYTERY